MLEPLPFVGADLGREHFGGALYADDGGQRQRDVRQSERAFLHARHGQHATLVPQDAAQEIGGDESDGVIGRPLRPMISYTARRTSTVSSVSRRTSQPGRARSGTPPTRDVAQRGTDESPCSPTTWA